ncbi:hypothetical protein EG338_07150 [Kaistella haifensis]|nr:hypothetical protein EG338_07150 [Kaistella haifensis]
MKKIVAFMMLAGLGNTLSAQYMIIGKDSISLTDFKKEYQYGLQNAGITKTIKATEDFILLQQFAAQKMVDTTASFREKMMDKEGELRSKFFYPKNVVDPVLNQYLKDSQTEKLVQIFMVQKAEGDKNNYQQIYDDVKSGKMTMEDAISKYTKNGPKGIYIKPGSVDNSLYSEIKVLPNNSLTKLQNTPNYVAFAKVQSSRPSLGYMIFGTISYPKNAESEAMKTKIYTDLKSGKSFQEVAKLYGANEHEKENGGVVMGSPTLPDDVYEAFKGKKSGYYLPEPILFGENYFVFNLYNVEPYILTDKNREFFLKDMNSALYGENLQEKMLAFVKSDPSYKEFPEFQNVKKSYQAFNAAKDNTVLYQYKKYKTTIGDLKKLIADKKSEAEKLTPELWAEALKGVNDQDVMRFYSEDFTNQKRLKKNLPISEKVCFQIIFFQNI